MAAGAQPDKILGGGTFQFALKKQEMLQQSPKLLCKSLSWERRSLRPLATPLYGGHLDS